MEKINISIYVICAWYMVSLSTIIQIAIKDAKEKTDVLNTDVGLLLIAFVFIPIGIMLIEYCIRGVLK